MKELIYVATGVGFIFFMHCIGSAFVFFFYKSNSKIIRTIFLGFCAGIFISAAILELLPHSIEQGSNLSIPDWIPAVCGFIIGVLFLFILDIFLSKNHSHSTNNNTIKSSTTIKRTALIISAVAMHHIPEGMAVGLSFLIAAQSGDAAMYASAMALSFAVGIQCLPEGAAIAIPLKQEGYSAIKAFLLSCLSGITGPISGLLMIIIASTIMPYMSWLLSFAAGAMIYVAIEELIPE